MSFNDLKQKRIFENKRKNEKNKRKRSLRAYANVKNREGFMFHIATFNLYPNQANEQRNKKSGKMQAEGCHARRSI